MASLCLTTISPFKTTSLCHFKPYNNNYFQARRNSFLISCSIPTPKTRSECIPNHIPDPKYVRVFDITLRDGEQSPGATMTTEKKLHNARHLAKLGVDIIEVGFPALSEADLEAVKLIAKEVGNCGIDELDGHVPVICGLARCNKTDIDKARQVEVTLNGIGERAGNASLEEEFCKCLNSKTTRIIGSYKSSLAIQIGALLATVAEPAVAITGVNNEEDFTWVLIQLGISAFFYFIVSPPIIMNWLRIRWYRRNLLEMYLQFMFVFLFFPGVLLWAPFLNFRKFPRDPSMKYPWDKPENPSQIKGGFLKWPYATPEDYDQ